MIFRKVRWSATVEKLLRPIVVPDQHGDTLPHLRECVECGSMELFQIDDASLALISMEPDSSLFVRAYTGKNLRGFADTLYRIAQKNGLERIIFESPEPHTLKLLDGFKLEQDGERYIVRVHPLYSQRSVA